MVYIAYKILNEKLKILKKVNALVFICKNHIQKKDTSLRAITTIYTGLHGLSRRRVDSKKSPNEASPAPTQKLKRKKLNIGKKKYPVS